MILLKTIVSIETAMYTLTGGIVLFLLSKIIENTLITPFQAYVKVKGKVNFLLIYHANKFGNIDEWEDKEKFIKGLDEIREISSEVYSLSCMYRFARFCGVIPSKEDLEKVGEKLMGLSNATRVKKGDNFTYSERIEEIKVLLKLKKKRK